MMDIAVRVVQGHPSIAPLSRTTTMVRPKQPPGPPPAPPTPPWLLGAMIGMTIMSMAGTAMSLGVGLALTRTGGRQ